MTSPFSKATNFSPSSRAGSTSARPASGWAGAQANLGLAYVGGVGVPVDLIEGDKWLRIAAQRALGDDQLRYNDLREALEEKMSAEAVVEAWQRAREWNHQFARR